MFIKSSIFRTIFSPKLLFHQTKGFSLRDKMIMVLIVVIIVGSFVWWMFSIFRFITVAQPTYGGHYIEAFVGQPRYLNPLLSHSSSADRGLTRLIFSGLFEYDENGLLKEDLAEHYEVSDDLKEYTVFLRKNSKWHDGEIVSADDVIFTIDIARDIAYGAAGVSNDVRLVWHGVKTEKIDDLTVKFILEKPNSMFLHNLTIGLLPKHVWENIGPEQFQLSEFNQKPIGSGPYEFVDVNLNTEEDTISAYILRANEEYYKGEPFITKFTAQFYPTRAEAVAAYYDGAVSGVVVDKKEHTDTLDQIAQKHSISLPHYFAVFFNQTRSIPLAFDEVREALVMATDREEVVKSVFGEDAQVRYSPFAEGVVGFDAEMQQPKYDLEGANKLLDKKGWKRGEDGIREKDGDRLAFTLHINGGQSEIVSSANILTKQWEKIGADVKVQEHDRNDLEINIIKPRDYDAIIYAHQMRFEPNLFPLWDGEEKDDPGMNYALFDDDEMNQVLSDLLITKDEIIRMDLYKKQQERLKAEMPAIFLFAPKLSLIHNDSVKNIRANRVNVSYDRYTDVHLWYIKEKRVKK